MGVETRGTLLGQTLLASVSLKIQGFKESGGLTAERLAWLQQPEVDGVLEKADVTILHGGTTEGFNTLSKIIALMSFIPGGIEVFGTHWDATRDFPYWRSHD